MMLRGHLSHFHCYAHVYRCCLKNRTVHRCLLWNDPMHSGPLMMVAHYTSARLKTIQPHHSLNSNTSSPACANIWRPVILSGVTYMKPAVCLHWKSKSSVAWFVQKQAYATSAASKQEQKPPKKEKRNEDIKDELSTSKNTLVSPHQSTRHDNDLNEYVERVQYNSKGITPAPQDSADSMDMSEGVPVEKIQVKTVGKGKLQSKVQSKVQSYFIWRFSYYLDKFHTSLKNEMPETFNMIHVFTAGVKEFIVDFKDFLKVVVFLSLPGSTLRSMSYREQQLYYRMPSDMIRVFPVLVLSSLPFGQNIAFPVGYWFPRHLLCRHFWNIQQTHEFAVMALKKRLFNARPVFRCLQAAVPNIKDAEAQEQCRDVFSKLGSGIHPTTDEIIALLPLFQAQPFHLKEIRMNHVNGLLRLHGRSVWPPRRRRLKEHGRILHCMDTALSREGIHTLNHAGLKAALFFRGLNPTNMSTAAMVEFLEDWLRVSQQVDQSTYSLLLHLPILLTYNQTSNIVLIY